MTPALATGGNGSFGEDKERLFERWVDVNAATSERHSLPFDPL